LTQWLGDQGVSYYLNTQKKQIAADMNAARFAGVGIEVTVAGLNIILEGTRAAGFRPFCDWPERPVRVVGQSNKVTREEFDALSSLVDLLVKRLNYITNYITIIDDEGNIRDLVHNLPMRPPKRSD